LGYSIQRVALVTPEMMSFLNKNSYQLAPAIEEIGHIRKILPTVILEIQEIKKLVPTITNEMAKISAQIPGALSTVDTSADVISKATNEISSIRKNSLPQILQESKKIRESIPVYLNSAGRVISDAHLVVKDASRLGENASSGVITGIVTSPFKLVSSMTSSIADVFKNEELSKKDIAIITETGLNVLNSNQVGYFQTWENSESSRHGMIKLISVDESEKCSRVEMIINQKKKKIISRNYKLCKGMDDQWTIVKDY
jgi:hypothetical protein